MQHLWWELNVWNSLDLQLNFKVIRFRASCYLRTLLCRCVVMIWSKVCQVLVTQSCLTLCDPMDYSSPGSSVHGISQARILEWVAISFSRGSSWPRDGTQVFWIAGRFFTVWATREAQNVPSHPSDSFSFLPYIQPDSISQPCNGFASREMEHIQVEFMSGTSWPNP